MHDALSCREMDWPQGCEIGDFRGLGLPGDGFAEGFEIEDLRSFGQGVEIGDLRRLKATAIVVLVRL